MESNSDQHVRWDVGMALRDLAMEMLNHHQSDTAAAPETIRRWQRSLHLAHRAHSALAWTCEDLVEQGATSEHLEAMKVALTHAMGQETYCARGDRW